ncbi:16681_t:CDS:2, partial [Racocetra fulgida]
EDVEEEVMEAGIAEEGNPGRKTSRDEGQRDEEHETSAEPSTQNIEPNNSDSNYELDISKEK